MKHHCDDEALDWLEFLFEFWRNRTGEDKFYIDGNYVDIDAYVKLQREKNKHEKT